MNKLLVVLFVLGLCAAGCKPGTKGGKTDGTNMTKKCAVEAVCEKMDACKQEQLKKLTGALKAKYAKEVPSKADCMKKLKKSKDEAKNKACKAALEKAACGDVTEMKIKECKHLL